MHLEKNLRVLSGIQPSGALHLGNYFGMIETIKSIRKLILRNLKISGIMETMPKEKKMVVM